MVARPLWGSAARLRMGTCMGKGEWAQRLDTCGVGQLSARPQQETRVRMRSPCQGVSAGAAERSPWVEGWSQNCRTGMWWGQQGLGQEDQGSLQGLCPPELPEELGRDLFIGTEIKGRSLLTRNEARTQLLELKTWSQCACQQCWLIKSSATHLN